ncbi:thiol-disulfide oxidoreductase DCC family protein [Flavicella marina]|uniref:thiol-disulfide oxidoreductase DCC family protein n=1 Tax=Flavicella marina TaxID=1475951 RepID=UPI001D02896B|nr:DUF393 domain-containing protein [Flavicella marina]
MKTVSDINNIRKTKSVILFDGLCSLCDSSVQFVLKRDTKNKFVFASLQSEVGVAFLKTQPETIRATDSIILVTENNVYSKSTAALHIAKSLNGFWPISILFILIPNFFRDWVYDGIAKKRYKWFGKLETCRVPTQEEKKKFID